MLRLFVSYSRKDSLIVSHLARRLGDSGHAVWLDTSTIQGGARWQEEIVQGIERCDLFLVMLSRESIQSENVARELGLAYVNDKSIVPVVLDAVVIPPRMEYALSGVDAINLADKAIEAAANQLLDGIALPKVRTPRRRHQCRIH